MPKETKHQKYCNKKLTNHNAYCNDRLTIHNAYCYNKSTNHIAYCKTGQPIILHIEMTGQPIKRLPAQQGQKACCTTRSKVQVVNVTHYSLMTVRPRLQPKISGWQA